MLSNMEQFVGSGVAVPGTENSQLETAIYNSTGSLPEEIKRL